jgi:hypothetical protein
MSGVLNLGFVDGLHEKLIWSGQVCDDETKKLDCNAIDWLRYGAEKEAAQISAISGRFNNHFHEPLSGDGLDDYVVGLHATGESCLEWAQDDEAQSVLGIPEGDQSWTTLRQLFYIALIHADESVREETFAQVFKGLGHQMHLVQDMAVPYHVRNDAHPLESFQSSSWKHYLVRRSPLYFETWAKMNPDTINMFATSAGNNDFPNLAFDEDYPGVQCPVSQLWDADVYNGHNPSTTTAQGLAEYTSANFFSEGTLFAAEKGEQELPYPKRSSMELVFLSTENGNKLYLAKRYDGENVDHFVRVGYCSFLLDDPNSAYIRDLSLDESCHRDYTEKLVPRAVGYSAALLNYFFKGKIEIVPDTENGQGYVIENKTETEEDMEGTFEIYYDNTNGERVKLWSDFFTLGAMSSGNNKSNNIEFDHPVDAMEPGKYILVFKGRLGHDQDFVIAGISVLEDGEFIYFSMGEGSSGVTPKSIVWDIARNDYASINDSEGNPIDFPCDPTLLADWLNTHPSKNVNNVSWSEPFAIGPPGVSYQSELVNSCSSTPAHMCHYGAGDEQFEDESWIASQGLVGQEDYHYRSVSYNCCGQTGPYQHCQPNPNNPTWYTSDWHRELHDNYTIQAVGANDWYGQILGSHRGAYNSYTIINRMGYQSGSINAGSRRDTYNCSEWNMDEAHDFSSYANTNHRLRTFLGDWGEITLRRDSIEHLVNYNPTEGEYVWQYVDATYPKNYYQKIVGLISDRTVAFVFLYQYRLKVL